MLTLAGQEGQQEGPKNPGAQACEAKAASVQVLAVAFEAMGASMSGPWAGAIGFVVRPQP